MTCDNVSQMDQIRQEMAEAKTGRAVTKSDPDVLYAWLFGLLSSLPEVRARMIDHIAYLESSPDSPSLPDNGQRIQFLRDKIAFVDKINRGA